MRSATFCLGFIRGIRKLIPQFHYLSTVSGGGYAGAWLSSLLQNPKWSEVEQVLENRSGGAGDSNAITHLRRYSDLLEARSWLSTTALSLVSNYLRSLVIWWLLYIPIALTMVALPWLLSMLEETLRAPVRPLPALLVLLVSVAGSSASLSLLVTEREPAQISKQRSLALACAVLAVFAAGAASNAMNPIPIPASLAWRAEYLWVLVALVFAIAGVTGPAIRGRFDEPWQMIATLGGVTLALAWAGAEKVLQLLSPVVDPTFPFAVPLFAAGSWLSGAVVVGALGRSLSDSHREAFADWSARIMAVCLFVSLMSGLALYAQDLVNALRGQFAIVAGGTTLGGLITAYATYRSRIGTRRVSGWRKYAAHLATAVAIAFGVIIWLLLSLAWTWFVPGLKGWQLFSADDFVPNFWVPPLTLATIAVVMVGWCWWWSRRIGVNAFSLNGLYRVRIVRTFLANPERPADAPAPGDFSEADDKPLASLASAKGPLHLINVVLNDAGRDRLEWRDRRAVPFVLSSLYCGSNVTGYRPTDTYAGGKLTLGRAIAISGAAANPNMGHFSSRPVTWLLGLFNLRLGWWLGNPKDKTAWKVEEPANAVQPFVEEFLAKSGENSAFVNLSDGGHFENLGLYEVIRRECRYIVAVDASYDPDGKHLDLARVERLIRIDLGVELQWETSEQVGHYRVARIVYPTGEKGHLVYVSPQLTGNEPADVLAYAQQLLDRGEHFPHQATSDLWFDEAQFESYMKLGQHSAEALLTDMRPGLLETGLDPSPAAIADLTKPVDDVRPKTGIGITTDPVLAAAEPPPLPLPLDSETIQSWWKPLVKPVAASVLATIPVLGTYHFVFSETADSRRSFDERRDTVVMSRTATMLEAREQTFLLPWFDEFRPSPEDMRQLMKLAGQDLIGLRKELARLNDLARNDPKQAGAPLRPLDIDRIERLAPLLRDGCQPVVVRGLASTSPAVAPKKGETPSADVQAEIDACTTKEATSPVEDCRNVLLANRRADLVRAVLQTAKVETDVFHWDKNDARPMRDAQFDDRDPGANEEGAAADRYIVRRGAFNRSVELIPQGDSCKIDLIQRRLSVMVVDRPR